MNDAMAWFLLASAFFCVLLVIGILGDSWDARDARRRNGR